MKKTITKEIVSEVFEACLETALEHPEIKKPFSWALYHTWKEISNIEKPRKKGGNMTNEEAINGLQSLVEVRRKYGDMQTMQDEIECLDMAIAALKAEPCEDAVSREAVVSLAKDIVIGDYRHRCIDPQSVMELPPVTPKPTECEDCVSRKAVMQALTKLGYGDEENGADAEYMSALWDVTKKIESLPPVIPKARTGKWKIGGYNDDFYVCDCGFKYVRVSSKYNYCPNCGAKMEGESE